MKHLIVAIAAFGAASAAYAETPPAPPTEAYAADAEAACEAVDLTLYFEPGAQVLTSAAHRALDYTLSQLEGCAVTAVSARAISADAGDASQAADLAAARAEAVYSALEQAGFLPEAETTDIVLRRAEAGRTPILARRVELSLTAERAFSS